MASQDEERQDEDEEDGEKIENAEDVEDFITAPFLDKIVEIVGLRTATTIERNPKDRKSVRVEGKIGYAVSVEEPDRDSYIIRTFDGLIMNISEKNLRLYEMRPPEEGGCDLIFPVHGSAELFGNDVANCLARRGFCMVQMFEDAQTRREAAETVEEEGISIQETFRLEFESAYLGSNNRTQVMALPASMRDEEVSDSLTILNQQIIATCKGLESFVQGYFGHACWATTSVWARVSELEEDKDMEEEDRNVWSVAEQFVFVCPKPDPRVTRENAIGIRAKNDLVRGSVVVLDGFQWLQLEGDEEAWILIDGKAAGIPRKLLVRAADLGKAEAEEARALAEVDVAQKTIVEAYDQFLQGRKTCVLYMVNNAGGHVSLFPRVGSDLAAAGIGEVKLPITSNKMLIFRHDQMGYTYQPKGPSFALQSWMLTELPVASQNLKLAPLSCVAEPPAGENAQVMAIDANFAAGSNAPQKFWSMFVSATDSAIHWPIMRWETEPYYTPDPDYMMQGKGYTCHGGFMMEEDMILFDNNCFDISNEESMIMAPGQRIFLQVGYGCLLKAGHTRASLAGENVGVFCGDVGMDWHAFGAPWSWMKHNQGCDTKTLCESIHNGVTAGRLAFLMDLRGPQQTVDTACSASVIAYQSGYKQMMHKLQDDISGRAATAPHSILSGGVNTLLTGVSFVGNCMGNILTHKGRCFTFDQAADGYQRGEGTGCLFIKWSSDRMDIEERLAVGVGNAAGHDGKSASLTAPSGPAQQDLIKRACRMSGIDPTQLQIVEAHGTGTALGDPIEVGAIIAVMSNSKLARGVPALATTQKTNLSHLEACAGMAAMVKTVLSVMYCVGVPNVHLKTLNSNIVAEGFPIQFCQELTDSNFTTMHVGLSSFGFGGANARAEFFGRSVIGPHNTGNPWTDERKQDRTLAYAHGLRGGYKGWELFDQDPRTPNHIAIIGSWDNFEEPIPMDCDEPGCFTCRITLGDRRQESFGLLVNGDRDLRLFPCVDRANAEALITGPNSMKRPPYNTWLIDGKRDGVFSGAVYKITFKWQGKKSISWKAEVAQRTKGTAHDYFICGTWTAWVRQQMTCVSQEDGVHEAELQIKDDGFARFNFRRGRGVQSLKELFASRNSLSQGVAQTISLDQSGVIYGPTEPREQQDQFVVTGNAGQRMKVQLIALDGHIDVKVISDGKVEEHWRTKREQMYYVSGTFNGWTYTQMSQHSSLGGIYKLKLKVSDDELVEYKIMVEGQQPFEFVGVSSMVQRADPEVLDSVRDFRGRPGSNWEIVLDFNQDDYNRIIYHRPATDSERHIPVGI